MRAASRGLRAGHVRRRGISPVLSLAAMSSFPELYFNVDNGYLEGLVRGFKAGVLRQGDYVNLVQCESLEGEWRRGSEAGGDTTPTPPY